MSIYGETPGGSVNGTNRVFTTAQPYVTGTTRVFKNGARLDLGVDYTESAASTLTLAAAPSSGAVLLVDYDITAGGTNYPQGVWTFNPEGYGEGAALYNGPTLFPAGINPSQTQTAVAVFGPGGAVVNIPPVFDGLPGESPQLTKGTATTVGPGEPADFTLTQTAPGGPGEASVYRVDMDIPQGLTGADAANTLISPQPTDLIGTPQAHYMIGYSAGTNEAQWQPVPIVAWYNITNIPTTGTTGGQVRTLATLSITGGFPIAVTPFAFARSVITGTANTQVDVVARLGGAINQTNGLQIARGGGPPGSVIGTNPWSVHAIPEYAGLLTSNYAQVGANTGITIYLNCEQQASTADKYSTGTTSFTVGFAGVPL